MTVIFSSETSVYFHWTARLYIPQNRHFHSHRCENLKSNIIKPHVVRMASRIVRFGSGFMNIGQLVQTLKHIVCSGSIVISLACFLALRKASRIIKSNAFVWSKGNSLNLHSNAGKQRTQKVAAKLFRWVLLFRIERVNTESMRHVDSSNWKLLVQHLVTLGASWSAAELLQCWCFRVLVL
jgi:hypothetical protein